MPPATRPDATPADPVIGVVGAGVMGRGIAQIAVQAGIRVMLFDSRAGAAAEAREAIAAVLGRLVEKGKLSAGALADAISRLQVLEQPSGFSGCHVVIEAIVENLEAKRALFSQLEAIVADDCILATNTSSLQVSAIAAGCRVPERVAGFHFFNPVPLMKVVEVIGGVRTAPSTTAALAVLAERCGHRPVRASDTPGFIVNHAGRGYLTEALRIVSEGIADFAAVDRVLREAAGFRMGPFELLDLTGLDVSHPVMESIYHQYYEEPRYRPAPLTGQRVLAGLLGRKTGRGFYRYDGGRPQVEPEAPAPPSRPDAVWVSGSGLGAQLKPLLERLGARIDTGERPSPASLIMLAPLGHDATTSALAEGLDPVRTVAVDCLIPAPARRTLMTTPITGAAMRDAAHGLLAADGAPVTVIGDSPGFLVQRTLAQIVNIASDIAQQRIARPADIDAGVTLGLNYPKGPLAWGDAIGTRRILAILEALAAFYGDPRYRPSPWLKRRALLGVSLHTEQA